MYFKEDIIALEPRYIDNIGNMTCIHFNDGTVVEDKRRIPTIMQSMASSDLLDMKECRKFIGKHLGITKNIPYVFDLDNIFIAVKTRIPLYKNDGAMTFIKIKDIEKISGTSITMSNGLRIETLEKLTIVDRKVHQGKISGVIIKERKFIMNS